MSESPLSPHLATPAELQERLAMEREGEPFLAHRDAEGRQRLTLLRHVREIMIGRDPSSHVCLHWDPHVSVLHAELRRIGARWMVVDDGLSRNGTFVNEVRVVGRRRLRDRDLVRVGGTVLVFCNPLSHPPKSTAVASDRSQRPELSQAQRRVLVALCRPFNDGAAFARPATNQQIANELYVSVAAVKAQLRTLFERFGIEELPHNEKRSQLVRMAFETGAVSAADLGPPS